MPLKVRGFAKFLRAFSEGRIRGVLRDQQQLAMKRAVLFLRSEVLAYIDQEKHGIPNAPLTVLIKGSSRPLVDRGDLRQSIDTEVHGKGRDVVGAVGVLRSRRTKRGGKRLFNVAVALHNGFVIRVTPQVRAAVFAELQRRQGRGARPAATGGGSSTWRVRGRPFIQKPLEDGHDRIVAILGDGVLTWTKKI